MIGESIGSTLLYREVEAIVGDIPMFFAPQQPFP